MSTFGNDPVRLISADGEEKFDLPNPPHVHQPLIQTIVDELLGHGKCPSTGESGARTSKVMDAVLDNYYGGQREDAFLAAVWIVARCRLAKSLVGQTMRVDVLLTPRDVRSDRLPDRAVVVFDVLRATTTMTAALAAGMGEIRVFDSLDAAGLAAKKHGERCVLCGERNCLRAAGI